MADTLEELRVLLSLDDRDFDRGLDRVANRARDADRQLSSAFSGAANIAGGALVAGIGAATVAVGALGAAAIDVQNAASQISNAFGGLDDDTLQAVTDDALYLARSFDVDLTESARTADRIVGEFGGTAEEAFQTLERGQVLGLDRFGDLNDTLNEYSADFARMGLDANETLAILNRGLEAGFMNTDKIGDAFNEFGIRLRDPAIRDALGDVDAGLAAIVDQFATGEISENDAFQRIAAQIQAIDDPLRRAEAGVAIFGTTFEDFGEDATFALAEAIGSAEDMGIEIGDMQREYRNFGQIWADVSSRLQAALLPVANAMLELANQAMPHVSAAIDQITGAIGPLVAMFDETGDASVELGGTLDGLGETWQSLVDTVDVVVNAIQQLIERIFGTIIQPFLQQHGDEIRQTFSETWTQIQTIIQLALQLIESVVTQVLSAVGAFIDRHGDEILAMLSTTWDSITVVIDTALMAIETAIRVALAVINGDWQSAWNAIQQFSAAFVLALAQLFENGIRNLALTVTVILREMGVDVNQIMQNMQSAYNAFDRAFVQPVIAGFNAIIGVVDRAIGKLQEFQNLPGHILDEAAQGARLVTGQLNEDEVVPGYASGTMSAAPGWGIVGEDGPELIHFGGGEAVLPAPVTAGVMAGGGGGGAFAPTVNVTVGGSSASADEIASQVAAALRDAIGLYRRQGVVSV